MGLFLKNEKSAIFKKSNYPKKVKRFIIGNEGIKKEIVVRLSPCPRALRIQFCIYILTYTCIYVNTKTYVYLYDLTPILIEK